MIVSVFAVSVTLAACGADDATSDVSAPATTSDPVTTVTSQPPTSTSTTSAGRPSAATVAPTTTARTPPTSAPSPPTTVSDEPDGSFILGRLVASGADGPLPHQSTEFASYRYSGLIRVTDVDGAVTVEERVEEYGTRDPAARRVTYTRADGQVNDSIEVAHQLWTLQADGRWHTDFHPPTPIKSNSRPHYGDLLTQVLALFQSTELDLVGTATIEGLLVDHFMPLEIDPADGSIDVWVTPGGSLAEVVFTGTGSDGATVLIRGSLHDINHDESVEPPASVDVEVSSYQGDPAADAACHTLGAMQIHGHRTGTEPETPDLASILPYPVTDDPAEVRPGTVFVDLEEDLIVTVSDSGTWYCLALLPSITAFGRASSFAAIDTPAECDAAPGW